MQIGSGMDIHVLRIATPQVWRLLHVGAHPVTSLVRAQSCIARSAIATALAGDRRLDGDQIAFLDFPAARSLRTDLADPTHDFMTENLRWLPVGPMLAMNVVVVIAAADTAQFDFQYGVSGPSFGHGIVSHFNFSYIGDNGGQ